MDTSQLTDDAKSLIPSDVFDGGMAERSKASDCKSDDVRLRRFESCSLHHPPFARNALLRVITMYSSDVGQDVSIIFATGFLFIKNSNFYVKSFL